MNDLNKLLTNQNVVLQTDEDIEKLFQAMHIAIDITRYNLTRDTYNHKKPYEIKRLKQQYQQIYTSIKTSEIKRCVKELKEEFKFGTKI